MCDTEMLARRIIIFSSVWVCARECERRCNFSALKMRFSTAMALEWDREKCDAKNFFGTAWCSGCCRWRRRIILPLSSWDRFFPFLFSFCLDFNPPDSLALNSLFFWLQFCVRLNTLAAEFIFIMLLALDCIFCCCRRHRCCYQPAHERSLILFCF